MNIRNNVLMRIQREAGEESSMGLLVDGEGTSSPATASPEHQVDKAEYERNVDVKRHCPSTTRELAPKQENREETANHFPNLPLCPAGHSLAQPAGNPSTPEGTQAMPWHSSTCWAP